MMMMTTTTTTIMNVMIGSTSMGTVLAHEQIVTLAN
jgi:hypothetical protein